MDTRIPTMRAIVGAIPSEVLACVPEAVARARRCIPFARTDAGVKVGMVDAADAETQRIIAARAGTRVFPHAMSAAALARALTQYRASEQRNYDALPAAWRDARAEEEREATIASLCDALLRDAYTQGAADIVVSPGAVQHGATLRIDGAQYPVAAWSRALHGALIAHLRERAGLRAQYPMRTREEGAFRGAWDGQDIPVELAMVHTADGERATIRMLHARVRQWTTASLGFSDDARAALTRALAAPHGLVVLTGPRGSGVSATLTAAIADLVREGARVATVEDAMLFDRAGVMQYTRGDETPSIADGIRAAVRDGWGVIAVDAIRDGDAARAAAEAALGGHLVLAAMEADDAGAARDAIAVTALPPAMLRAVIAHAPRTASVHAAPAAPRWW